MSAHILLKKHYPSTEAALAALEGEGLEPLLLTPGQVESVPGLSEIVQDEQSRLTNSTCSVISCEASEQFVLLFHKHRLPGMGVLLVPLETEVRREWLS